MLGHFIKSIIFSISKENLANVAINILVKHKPYKPHPNSKEKIKSPKSDHTFPVWLAVKYQVQFVLPHRHFKATIKSILNFYITVL
jgi:hypothetical protein